MRGGGGCWRTLARGESRGKTGTQRGSQAQRTTEGEGWEGSQGRTEATPETECSASLAGKRGRTTDIQMSSHLHPTMTCKHV